MQAEYLSAHAAAVKHLEGRMHALWQRIVDPVNATQPLPQASSTAAADRPAFLTAEPQAQQALVVPVLVARELNEWGSTTAAVAASGIEKGWHVAEVTGTKQL